MLSLQGGAFIDLQNDKYLICDVPGDGSCFFHCLSLYFYNSFKHSELFRSSICTRIISNWPEWRVKATLNHSPAITKDLYQELMVSQKGWATALEIEAFSEQFKAKTIVWLSGTNSHGQTILSPTIYSSSNHERSIHILLRDNHFLLLRKIEPLTNNSQQNTLDSKNQPSVQNSHKRKQTSQNSPSKLLFYLRKYSQNNSNTGKKCRSKQYNLTKGYYTLYHEQGLLRKQKQMSSPNVKVKNNLSKPSPIDKIYSEHSYTASNRNGDISIKSDKLIENCRKLGLWYDLPPGTSSNITNWGQAIGKKIKREEKRLNIQTASIPEPPPLTSNEQFNHAMDRIRSFEIEQMTYTVNTCKICEETKINIKLDNDNICKRCKTDKFQVKMFSDLNNMNPGLLPDALKDMSVVEQQLIARISPCINVHMLKHGGIASSGHCVTFPQEINEPAQIFPRLPSEINIIKVCKTGKNNSSKEFRVRRHKVQSALIWLKYNNPAFKDILISNERLNALPVDGELDNIPSAFCSEQGDTNDRGPAPEQVEISNIDNCTTDSGVILPDISVDIKSKVQDIVQEVLGDNTSVKQNKNGTITIPWPTRQNTPLSEFTTQYFFTLAFPFLFPYGKADFHINRPRTCTSLDDWAEHLLWYKDGRFAHHPYFKFVVHNMILRKTALQRGNFIVKQALGDELMSIEDLKQRLSCSDTSIASKILYFSHTLRGTSQYWAQRNKEVRALVQFKVNNEEGLPAIFTTGSCAEFHFKPLRRLLLLYNEQITGKKIDLDSLSNAEVFSLLQKNTHIVGQYFDLRTSSYFNKVMGPVFGIDTFWYRQEFAKSRGMIHWHGLCWRNDRQPHNLMHECVEAGLNDSECAERLAGWAKYVFGLTASHPAGSDESGLPKKEYWPPPEGFQPAPSEEKNPLIKLLMDVSDSQESLLEDYLLLTNRVNIHRCSDYCLRKDKHNNSAPKQCRMEFGSENDPGKILREKPELVRDRNSSLRLEMERDHPMLVQNSRYHTQGWRANGDISIILSKSSPENPSVNEIIATERYITGYACKGNQSSESLSNLFNDIVHCETQSSTGSAKSLCMKFLMNTVKRDVSAIEASYEISKLPLFRSSHTFKHISLSGFRILEKNEDIATRSTALDKYIHRNKKEECSFYSFNCNTQNSVPVFSGITQASWPLDDIYCKNMLILHFPNWREISQLRPENMTWSEAFEIFLTCDNCPNFVKADVQRAKSHANQTLTESDSEDEISQASNQPEWANNIQPQPDFDRDADQITFDDWGDDYDWSAGLQNLPEDLGISFFDRICQTSTIEPENGDLILPDVDLKSLNEDQQFAFNIVLHTLFKVKNDKDSFQDVLRLIVSGTAGSGKSYLIKCIVKAARLLFQSNNCVQVVCPTGNSASLIDGVTLHSFLKIPTSNTGSEMSPPQGSTADSLQSNLEGLKILLVDERSLIGLTTLGWMEFMCRCGMEKGKQSEKSWGSLPAVVFFGDDIQLPPVLDCPVYKQKKNSTPASLHGSLVWQEFSYCVELKSMVRQNSTETAFRNILLSVRQYQAKPAHAQWLQQFQWKSLLDKYGESSMSDMHERGLFVFPTHDEVWAHNKLKLESLNMSTPVVTINSVSKGRHSNDKSNKASGLIQTLYLAKGCKVMLTINLAVKFNLFNGSLGIVRDIIFKNGRTHSNTNFPDVVIVEFPGYNGPCFIQDNPKIVPLFPVTRKIDCLCGFCKRQQIPLRLGWATTIHKCQGMTIGEGESNRYIVINPGTRKFESNNPGCLFVTLSRAKSTGTDSTLPDFAWHPSVLLNEDRVCHVVNTPTTRARSIEIQRLTSMQGETKQLFQFLWKNQQYQNHLNEPFYAMEE